MKLLSDILYKCELLSITGSTDIRVSDLTLDSRKVTAGSLFVALKGLSSDGHDFIASATEKGAVAILCTIMPDNPSPGITYVKVADAQVAMGRVAANFYDHPSDKLTVIGVTGTNGKTTIATLLYNLYSNSGIKCGLVSTISNKIGEDEVPAAYTTPDVIALNGLFAKMADQNCRYCFMEVSSHALHQKRVEGVNFAGGIFTNLTHDHLDYHKTFKEYLTTKKTFFDTLGKKAFALTNSDDKNGQVMLQNTSARKYSYGLKSMADYRGKVVENLLSGLVMHIDGKEVYCRLVGEFNASNLMAIYSCSRLLGMESDESLTALSQLGPVEGRFDYFISENNITGIVDYAHTPDALENVLKTIQNLRKGSEKVITVIGCGGNRDTEKRPAMASIAANYSDMVILTSDNPRFEEPGDILNDMRKGIELLAEKKTLVIENRKEAIKTAAALAVNGDIVLVAGKGHEKYQEIKGVKHPFDDKLILKEALA
ncbi:MAG: UDP-N-acetylmuramoyl-L-alanyl-D-glutamate--2,6-diaminopimelate ligase [Bacteroidetes bacterium]|nr:MAG: UDP-N-acetylmuramoyl-L-alanyl-D-glutamate--2,6-diaminopimelate ligase [Bacteroidota bacterium]